MKNKKSKKKKKKGFTLMEIIGAIIILGIIGIIAVVTFTNNLKGFREDYYTETIRTLTKSGKDFFNDNRKYRPGNVLEAKTVPISTLITQHYIDDIKDYKGNSCSKSSYVIVVKNGKDDYSYHACLVCSEDDFSNMNDKYCDSSWTNSTTIEYSIAKPPELYVYKGTPRANLRNELAIKASYVKKNAKGEVLGVVDGTGFDDAPTIYPDNIDIIDTNSLGLYTLYYTYQGQTVEGRVIVYEYKAPLLSITKENMVAINLNGGEISQTGEYVSGEWAQKIKVTLTPGMIDAGSIDISTANLSNIVHKYQWNKDGVWQDFCGGDNCESITKDIEMNEKINFRSIDINGKISKFTDDTTIRIDHTKPTCELTLAGEHKDNDWFTSNVTVNFLKSTDLVGTSSEAVSGVAVKNITKLGGELSREEVPFIIHEEDTAGIDYRGFVEDEAHNYITCDIHFRKDDSDPVCTIQPIGHQEEGNSWFNSSSVWIRFVENYDNLSNVVYGIDYTYDNLPKEYPEDTDLVTKTAHIKDEAGNVGTCTTSYKKDSTIPVCELKINGEMGDNNWYKSSAVTILFNSTSDNLSDVYKYGLGSIDGEHSKEHTSNGVSISYIGRIEDNAGNKNSCSIEFKKDDGSEISGCTISQKDNWTSEEGYTITTSLTTNPISGCKDSTGKYHSVGYDCVHQYGQPVPYYTAVDTINHSVTFVTNSGVSYTCSGEASVKIDNIPPECISSGGNDNWVNSDITITGTCNDNVECLNETISLPPFNTNTEQYNVTPGIVKDIAGNETQCPANQTVKIDKTPPTCETTSSASDWTNTSVTVTGTCSDTGGSGCNSNTSTVTNIIDYETNSSYSPGTVRDIAGNEKTCDSIEVKIDQTEPTCSISANTANWTNSDVILSISGTDSASGLGNNPYVIAGVTGESTGVPSNGTYSGSVTDKAGNTKTCSYSINNIDKAAPSCGTLSYGSDSTSGVNVTVRCSDTGGSNCSRTTFSTTATSTGSIVISDIAGNTASCPFTISSYKEHSTRSWDTCISGSPNGCIDWGYVYGGWTAGCTTRVDNDCNGGCSPGGTCSESAYNAGACSKTSCVSNGDGTVTVTECGCSRSWQCIQHGNTCQQGWTNWTGYTLGQCTGSNTSTWECRERTQYHGG